MRGLIALATTLTLGCGGGKPGDEDATDVPVETTDATDTTTETPDVPEEVTDPTEDPAGEPDEDPPDDPGEEEPAPECTTDGDCEDGDPCTTDTCSSTGTCEHAYSSDFLTIGSTTRVSNTAPNSYVMGLCWSGSEFGVTWHELGTTDAGPVYFKRISRDGTPIGSDVRVSTPSVSAMSGPLVWSGSEFGLSWMETYRVYFGRMSGAGTAVGSPIEISTSSRWQYHPSIAWSGSEYAVSWSEGGEIMLRRIEARGLATGITTNISETTFESFNPRTEWSGSEYGVAWTDSLGSTCETYFGRVSPAGAKVGTSTLVASVPWSCAPEPSPGLAWSGSEYGLGWFATPSTTNNVLFGRVSPDGTEVGTDTTVTSTSADLTFLDAEWADGTYGLAWTDSRHGNNEILFGVVSPTGTLIESDHNLTSNGSSSQYPILAWTGSQYGLAWDDTIDSTTNREVYFTLLTVCPGP